MYVKRKNVKYLLASCMVVCTIMLSSPLQVMADVKVTQNWGTKPTPTPTPKPVNPVVYRALLIGEADYADGRSDPLPVSRNDIEAMGKMLSLRNYGKNVTQKINLSKYAFGSAINSAFKGADSNDVSLFYFQGHGCKDAENPDNEGALVDVNGRIITMTELKAMLDNIPGTKILLLGSCSSGAGITPKNSKNLNAVRKLGEFINAKNYVVLSACEAYETSYYWKWPTNGNVNSFAFAYYITYGCGVQYGTTNQVNMFADYNKDKSVTADELLRYLNTGTQGLTNWQTAMLMPSGSNQVIAYNPNIVGKKTGWTSSNKIVTRKVKFTLPLSNKFSSTINFNLKANAGAAAITKIEVDGYPVSFAKGNNNTAKMSAAGSKTIELISGAKFKSDSSHEFTVTIETLDGAYGTLTATQRQGKYAYDYNPEGRAKLLSRGTILRCLPNRGGYPEDKNS